jgi:hypothetical protein
MKKIALLMVAAIIMLYSSASAGLSGLGLGIHGGMISGYDNPSLESSILDQYSGFELDDQMVDIGAHLNVGTFRIVEFGLNLDYAWKKQDITSDTELRYNDFSVSASIRKSIPLMALKPYVAAGVAMHWLGYSLSVDEQVVGVYLPEEGSKLGYFGKGGIALDIPVFPLTPFVEFQYNLISTSGDDIKYKAIIGGLTLDLP